MAISPYKYQSPLDKGYIRVKLTRKEHNELFHYRRRDIRIYSEIYYNGNYYIAEHFTRLWWVALMAIPGLILGTLVDGAPSTWRDLKRAFRQRHYGSFRADQGPLSLDNYSPEFQPIIDAWLKEKASSN